MRGFLAHWRKSKALWAAALLVPLAALVIWAGAPKYSIPRLNLLLSELSSEGAARADVADRLGGHLGIDLSHITRASDVRSPDGRPAPYMLWLPDQEWLHTYNLVILLYFDDVGRLTRFTIDRHTVSL